jgi:hypothetical protein
MKKARNNLGKHYNWPKNLVISKIFIYLRDYFNEAKFGFAIVSGEKGMNNFIGNFNHKLMSKKNY